MHSGKKKQNFKIEKLKFEDKIKYILVEELI